MLDTEIASQLSFEQIHCKIAGLQVTSGKLISAANRPKLNVSLGGNYFQLSAIQLTVEGHIQ